MFETDPTIQDASKSGRTNEIRPDRDIALPESLVDTTNLAVATYYYPSATGAAMLPTKDLSLTGKLIAAATGTVTLTVEVTNDEDLTATWHDITMSGYRPDDNTIGNASITVSNGTEEFAICFDELNFDYYRIKVVILVSAVNTVIIKQRKKVL